MNDTMMKLTELCRYYKRGQHEVRAVDGVSLKFAKGVFVGIVGSSGSGKSTLLNLMAGLDTPTSGQIEVDGVILGNMTRRELAAYRARRVGMIFQSFNLIQHHTALKNVEMALYFNGTPKKERQKLAGDILEKLGLADRLNHCPGDLSGGEQQRVAIARALVKKPEIIFADEPTGNLDHENTLQISELLKKLNDDGQTIIMVTHNLAMAEKYAGRTIKMHYGSIADADSGSEGGRL